MMSSFSTLISQLYIHRHRAVTLTQQGSPLCPRCPLAPPSMPPLGNSGRYGFTSTSVNDPGGESAVIS